jgi:formyltetrahydrofolate deformylase
VDVIATLQCKDRPGIVHAMTTSILEASGNIIENQQFTDPVTSTFVMRTRFESSKSLAESTTILSKGLSQFSPQLHLRDFSQNKRALIMVSRESHCLRDLLYLVELGELPITITSVSSNHSDLGDLVKAHGIPFRYIDVKPSTKSASEAELLQLIKEEKVDLVVLARYMQILSSEVCNAMKDQIINIHHSFLPSFKGSKPYHQAHEKGVKIIGATAHFVTEKLDEGPIIEQDVVHVNHAATPEQLVSIGRDIERRVLAKAVRLYAEDRIFIVGNRTVVFQ